MGWQACEDLGGFHEGWIVGYEMVDGSPRQITSETAGDRREIEVKKVQVVCDCGWRSHLMHAPLGSHWWPNIVQVDRPSEILGEPNQDRAHKLWRRHIEDVKAYPPPTGLWGVK